MTPAPITSQAWRGWTLDATRLGLCYPPEGFEARITATFWPATKLLDLIFDVTTQPWATSEVLGGLCHLLADVSSLGLHYAPLNPVALREALEAWAAAHAQGER